MDCATCGATAREGSVAPRCTTNEVAISSTQKLEGSGINQSRAMHRTSKSPSSQFKRFTNVIPALKTRRWESAAPRASGARLATMS